MPLMPPAALISSIARMVALLSDSSMMAVVPVSENNTPTLISPFAATARSVFFIQMCGMPVPANAPNAAAPFIRDRRVTFITSSPEKQKSPPDARLRVHWEGFVADCINGGFVAADPLYLGLL